MQVSNTNTTDNDVTVTDLYQSSETSTTNSHAYTPGAAWTAGVDTNNTTQTNVITHSGSNENIVHRFAAKVNSSVEVLDDSYFRRA
jgi:hypothetical protein